MRKKDPEHTVRSYDEELKRLSNTIVRMGGLVERQLADAILSVTRRDSDLASEVVSRDPDIDALETEIQAQTIRTLALRQPLASDLRTVLGALKISSDLERIGDYIKSVAKRAMVLNQIPPVRPVSAVPRMARLVQDILNDVLYAFVERDVSKALHVWERDEEVDELYTSLFRELLTYMMEDPRTITACTHLMFIAKNIERMGDHATNIAETIYFAVEGQPLGGERPKGDDWQEFTLVTPDHKEVHRS